MDAKAREAYLEKLATYPLLYATSLFEKYCLDQIGLLRADRVTFTRPGAFQIEVTAPMLGYSASQVAARIQERGASFLISDNEFLIEFLVEVNNLREQKDFRKRSTHFWYSVSAKKKGKISRGLKNVIVVTYRLPRVTNHRD